VGPDLYLSGLEFADQQTPSSRQSVNVLMEKVNWILSFYDDKREDQTGQAR
jgi:hypothetical protein